MSVFVCLSVCPRAYLWNCTTDFYEIFCACCIVYDSHSVHALHPTYSRFIIHHWLPSGADNNLLTQKFDTFINSCIIACLTFKLPCDKQPKCHNLSNLNVRQAIMQELLKNVVILCWQLLSAPNGNQWRIMNLLNHLLFERSHATLIRFTSSTFGVAQLWHFSRMVVKFIIIYVNFLVHHKLFKSVDSAVD